MLTPLPCTTARNATNSCASGSAKVKSRVCSASKGFITHKLSGRTTSFGRTSTTPTSRPPLRHWNVREGQKVEKSNLSAGDLVFFRTYAKYPSHVGIYLGDNRFVHASARERKVTIESLDTPYYVKRYIGAKRLLLEEGDLQN